MSDMKQVFKTEMRRDQAEALKDPKVVSHIRRSHELEVKLANPSEFFKDIMKPTEGRLSQWLTEVKDKTEEQLDTTGRSRIVEVDARSGKFRWKTVKTWAEYRGIMVESEKAYDRFMQLRETRIREQITNRKQLFEDFGFAGDTSNPAAGFPVRDEYTPLIGSPFYKQMYLYDYWAMHSKCFWYSNYSSIAKMVVDITRNFVMGQGFTVVFSSAEGKGGDKLVEKCQDIWKRYEDRTNIQEAARNWSDDLCKFGENMLRKVPTPKGLVHRSFDPSTCWEIVTDPEDIQDVKYYHQQYNTQYQLYAAAGAPISKYVINQLPPSMVHHTKVNITSYEKRGRSDLLAPLLYFKYYEDYMQARLIRAKNEAAFIWDVTIKGGDEDLQAYISGTESMIDVPPGSENVHNDVIERKPLSPVLSAAMNDHVSADILSVVAMGTSIPASFFGTINSGGGATKAGALVNTEPVVKKMAERQNKMKTLLRQIVNDVFLWEGIDLVKAGIEFEIGMPDILEGDSQAKVEALYLAKEEKVISHRTMSHLAAKELKIHRYSYEDEQKQIEEEQASTALFPEPDLAPGEDGLTNQDDGPENQKRDNKKDTNKDERHN